MIISHGKLVASDTPENLGGYMKHSDITELQVRGSREACEQAMELLKTIEGLEVKASAATLEDVFLELTSEETQEEEAEECASEETQEEEAEELSSEEIQEEEAEEHAGDL
jgi:ABC-2 type transport system ATP-binding protein